MKIYIRSLYAPQKAARLWQKIIFKNALGVVRTCISYKTQCADRAWNTGKRIGVLVLKEAGSVSCL